MGFTMHREDEARSKAWSRKTGWTVSCPARPLLTRGSKKGFLKKVMFAGCQNVPEGNVMDRGLVPSDFPYG